LLSAQDGGWWSALCPRRSTPEETAPDAYLTGNWVGPTASVNILEHRKVSSPSRESNDDSLVVHPVV